MKSINIDGQEIGQQFQPYVIAELSANHNGKLDNAVQLLNLAKQAKVNAVKLQTYTADTITLKSDDPIFQITDGPLSGRSFIISMNGHILHGNGIEICLMKPNVLACDFSSPFDKSAIDFLEKLNVVAYKIASFEIVDLQLIEYAARTGKPLIISQV